MATKPYLVDVNGIEHTMLLTEEHAERLGDRARPDTQAKSHTPANKARTPSNKARAPRRAKAQRTTPDNQPDLGEETEETDDQVDG